jgi:hypothetical protein
MHKHCIVCAYTMLTQWVGGARARAARSAGGERQNKGGTINDTTINIRTAGASFRVILVIVISLIFLMRVRYSVISPIPSVIFRATGAMPTGQPLPAGALVNLARHASLTLP